ncbi:MAG: cytochrome C biogenesis protein ResB [Thermodesulfovibrionales bacterium]
MKILFSLNTGIVLLLILLLLLIAGAFIMPSDQAFGLLYVMPLFYWLKEVPFQISWWLILSITVIAMLAVNTLLCSADSIIKKYKKTNFLLIIAPQIMHLGVLFIFLGHLLSSYGGYRELFNVREGTWLRLTDGSIVEIKEIIIRHDNAGYITDTGMEVIHHSSSQDLRYTVIPNKPFIHKGTGLYLKTASPYPVKQAIVEISREPGAIPALLGGIFFATGNIVLLVLKTRRAERKN